MKRPTRRARETRDEFLIRHALWRMSNGDPPVLPLDDCLNPRKALRKAVRMMAVYSLTDRILHQAERDFLRGPSSAEVDYQLENRHCIGPDYQQFMPAVSVQENLDSPDFRNWLFMRVRAENDRMAAKALADAGYRAEPGETMPPNPKLEAAIDWATLTTVSALIGFEKWMRMPEPPEWQIPERLKKDYGKYAFK